MKNKLSESQNKIIELMKFGNYTISYFRGIGTRFNASASIQDSDFREVQTVSVATVKALRDKGYLTETFRDFTHSTYSLKN